MSLISPRPQLTESPRPAPAVSRPAPLRLERAPLSPKAASLQTYQYDIVLGCPRSGTTFLMEVLNALPDVECVTGTILPVSIPQIVNAADLSPTLYDALAVGFERALDDYMASGRFRSRAAALQKWINAPTGLKGLYDALRRRRSLTRLIYKEPFLSFAPEFVYYALPDANIIHLVRDGRDCANSLRRSYDVLTDENLTHLMGSEMRLGRKVDDRYVPWWVKAGREEAFLAAAPYVRAVWMWAYMTRRCHDFFGQPSVRESGRVLTIRYEDLMRNPSDVGRTMLDHLAVEASPGFLRRIRRAHTDSIGNHRHRPRDEREAGTEIARDELALYDYL